MKASDYWKEEQTFLSSLTKLLSIFTSLSTKTTFCLKSLLMVDRLTKSLLWKIRHSLLKMLKVIYQVVWRLLMQTFCINIHFVVFSRYFHHFSIFVYLTNEVSSILIALPVQKVLNCKILSSVKDGPNSWIHFFCQLIFQSFLFYSWKLFKFLSKETILVYYSSIETKLQLFSLPKFSKISL